MKMTDLSGIKRVHFIGIGGIGMSGLAKVLAESGVPVSGSDVAEGYTLPALRALGVEVSLCHDASQVEGADVVVVSTAVKADNPELLKAQKNGTRIIHRSEMLALLMKGHKTISIAGTHGKTTTTSLMSAVIEGAGMNPTVVNGGIIHAYGTNAKTGTGEWFVAEADESDGSFLNLPSDYVIVTNIDPDHMDYYESEDRLYDAFTKFINQIPATGAAVVCGDHAGIQRILQGCKPRVITYGEGEDNHYCVTNCVMDESGALFDVIRPHQDMLPQVRIPLLGRHNVLNALSVIAMACELGIADEAILSSLQSVKGVDRRFTKVGQVNDIRIIDDYAHHPIEIAAVLQAARQVSKGRVIAVFQPHRYSRFSALYNEFLDVLMAADTVLVTPVYGAGEDPVEGCCHEVFVQKLKEKGHRSVYSVSGYEALPACIAEVSQPQDYVLCMGAGSITKWARQLGGDLKANFFYHKECA